MIQYDRTLVKEEELHKKDFTAFWIWVLLGASTIAIIFDWWLFLAITGFFALQTQK